jgi:hypothetical protein
LFTNRY